MSFQFLQQYRHYQSNVEIFKHQPDKPNKDLADLVMFLAQVWRCSLFLLYLTAYGLLTYCDVLSPGWTLLLGRAVRLPTAADWSSLKPSYCAGVRSQNGPYEWHLLFKWGFHSTANIVVYNLIKIVLQSIRAVAVFKGPLAAKKQNCVNSSGCASALWLCGWIWTLQQMMLCCELC